MVIILCICIYLSILTYVSCIDNSIVIPIEFYPAYERYNLAVDHARHNRISEAIETYKEAIELKHDLCEAHQNIGKLYQFNTKTTTLLLFI